MKILSTSESRLADQYTIEHEPIASIDLMERAARAFCSIFKEYFPAPQKVMCIAGSGNNGGDALAIARILVDDGYRVRAIHAAFQSKCSPDMEMNARRLEREGHVPFLRITEPKELPELEEGEIVVDGLFGSGLNRPLEGVAARFVDAVNQWNAPCVAVDIPSGLFADKASEGSIIRAQLTITFQTPKLAFFMEENAPYTGEWEVADIGLDREFIERLETPWHTLDFEDLLSIWKPRPRFAHKGHFGHVLIAAGRKGSIGAAILCTRAVLASGAGLATAHIPECGYTAMQTAVPEAMVQCDADEDKITEVRLSPRFGTVACGPGIGTEPETVRALSNLLENQNKAFVLDADALNILSEHRELMEKIPTGIILTPHPGEFARIAGKSPNSFARLEKARELALSLRSVIVLKGAYTAVCLPDGHVFFNMTGNPGMATAGSGDVLTGMIASLRAQQYSPENATKLGVFLHGLAGDLAAEKVGESGLTARHIIRKIGKAARFFEE